jgi:hypothetical protein
MSRAQQAVKEFRAAVAAEFAFLPTEFGFVEEAVQRPANEFSLCFVNPARASLSRASRTVRGLRSARPDFNPLP